MLLNNFIAKTTQFFNGFSENVEKKISDLSNKVTELEILLAVLEAKLNSIPGLIDKPIESPEANRETKPETQNISSQDDSSLPNITTNDNHLPEVSAQSANDSPPEGMIKASEHKDYIQFFKLLKVGVPLFVVQGKMSVAGLNADLIETPDALIPI